MRLRNMLGGLKMLSTRNIHKITVGADPEVFLQDKEGKLISAVGLVKGTKSNPFVVNNGAVQLDGMAAEFNIDPVGQARLFKRNINSVMKQLDSMVGENTLTPLPTAHFGAEYIASQPEEARILGCEPDFNAYTGRENPKPDVETPFRTGAGHIHVGFTNVVDPKSESHMQDCRLLAAVMDNILAVPSILFDDDCERRQLYGKAGAFRPKTYGMEYRTLSNKWLSHPKLIDWAFKSTVLAFNACKEGKGLGMFSRINDSWLSGRHTRRYGRDITVNSIRAILNAHNIPFIVPEEFL
jgi:hypothetical protein